MPESRRRTKLAKTLDKYGDRVQYSVFEALLERSLFDKMFSEICELIEPNEDRVTIYMLCAACAPRAARLGLSARITIPGEEIVFIV